MVDPFSPNKHSKTGMSILNNNLLCVVDVETTGVRPGYHEIIQLTLYPLNKDINRQDSKNYPLFDIYIKPDYPERLQRAGNPTGPEELKKVMEFGIPSEAAKALFLNWYHNLDWPSEEDYREAKLQEAIKSGVDKYVAAELLEEWFEKLGLPDYKKIMPIAHNWVFDRSFLYEWLGHETFEYVFHPHYRDTMVAALYQNDCATLQNGELPFGRVALTAICSNLGIEYDPTCVHEALYDCSLTAKAYKKMLTNRVVM